jgi:hypothetical protein
MIENIIKNIFLALESRKSHLYGEEKKKKRVKWNYTAFDGYELSPSRHKKEYCM